MSGNELLSVNEILDVLDKDGEWNKAFVKKHGFIPSTQLALHFYLKESEAHRTLGSTRLVDREETVLELIEGI